MKNTLTNLWNNSQKRKILLTCVAVLWFIICVLITPIYTTVTLNFENDPSGEAITTVFAGPRSNVVPSDAKSRVINSGVARISYLDFRYGTHCSFSRF